MSSSPVVICPLKKGIRTISADYCLYRCARKSFCRSFATYRMHGEEIMKMNMCKDCEYWFQGFCRFHSEKRDSREICHAFSEETIDLSFMADTAFDNQTEHGMGGNLKTTAKIILAIILFLSFVPSAFAEGSSQQVPPCPPEYRDGLKP